MSNGVPTILDSVRLLFQESRKQFEDQIRSLDKSIDTKVNEISGKVGELSGKLDSISTKVVDMDRLMAASAPTSVANENRMTQIETDLKAKTDKLEAEVKVQAGKIHELEKADAKNSWVPALAGALVSVLLMIGLEQIRKPATPAPAASPPIIIYTTPSEKP